jgi:hypothetical protein
MIILKLWDLSIHTSEKSVERFTDIGDERIHALFTYYKV